MGITENSLNRFNLHIATTDTMLVLGCQNMYNNKNYGELARDYFNAKGFTAIDMDITGCQGSITMDLREALSFKADFGIVMQHGTIEHIDGSLYQPFKNIHEACAINGLMLHENPAANNWPGHGYHYFTQKFYVEFAKACNYELLEVCTEAAMGNTVDGWNICAVLKKLPESSFISEEVFNELYSKYIKSK